MVLGLFSLLYAHCLGLHANSLSQNFPLNYSPTHLSLDTLENRICGKVKEFYWEVKLWGSQS